MNATLADSPSLKQDESGSAEGGGTERLTW